MKTLQQPLTFTGGNIFHLQYGALKLYAPVQVNWGSLADTHEGGVYYIAAIEEDFFPSEITVWIWDAVTCSLEFARIEEITLLTE